MKKLNALLGSFALMGLTVTAGCSGGDSGPPPPAEEVETAEPAEPAEPEVTEDPEVEPTGRVIEIEMLTVDPEDPSQRQVFKPRLVVANVGDTVTFVPTDPSHQSSSIDSMVPDGVRGWEGEINEAVSYVLPKPGIYGYQCVPHYAAGMVGLIIVQGEGMLDNLEEARAVTHPGMASTEFEEIFAEAESEGLLSQ